MVFYKLLARFNHPLAVTLGEEIPKSDKIAPNYKPRRPREIRVRGKMTDRGFEDEMNRLAREQSELLQQGPKKTNELHARRQKRDEQVKCMTSSFHRPTLTADQRSKPVLLLSDQAPR